MWVAVECYSGSTADERPISFTLDDREYFVEQVIDRWRGPDDLYFRLRADDGCVYTLRLRQDGEHDDWRLEAIRRPRSEASGA